MGESQISIWNKSFYKLKSEYDLLIAILYKFALMPRMLVQTKIVGAFDFYITRFDCILNAACSWKRSKILNNQLLD